MTVHVVNIEQQNRAEEKPARWTKPDYQVIETSLEVTAYFVAES